MASRFSHPLSHRIAATALLAAMALPVLAQQPLQRPQHPPPPPRLLKAAMNATTATWHSAMPSAWQT